MQDQPLTNKTFMEFLDEFKKTNKLDTASNLLRTKYAREEVGQDNDKREKQLESINESMLEVKKAIENLSKNFTKSNDQVVKKLTEIQKTSAQYNPLSNIKDSRPVTLKEELKSGVAGIKRFGSSVADVFTGKSKLLQTRTPSGDIKAIGERFKSFGAGIKDIVGTSKDYTVEGGRFAEAFTKSPRGGLMQGKKTGFDVGLTKFNEMEAKEEEIKKLEEEIKISTRQGFEAPKGKTRQLEKLKAEFVELDPRKKIAPIEPKPEEVKQETAPIERKEVDSLIVDQYGTAFKREQTKEEAEQEKEQKSLIQTSDQPQPKKGLILPTGFQKEEDSSDLQPKESFSEKLVKLSEKSLAELRKITKALTGAAATSAAAPAAGGSEGAGGGSGGGGSMIGDAVSGAASAGIGGKILGGLATAGKVVGGALLSKPALIAGGVALAGYGAYKGYQAIKGAFGGGEKTTTETTPEVTEENKSFSGKLSGMIGPLQQSVDEGKMTPEQAIEAVKTHTSNGTVNGGKELLDSAIKHFTPQIGGAKGKTPQREALDQEIKSRIKKGARQDKILKDEFSDRMAKVGAYNKDTGEYDKSKFAEKDPEGHALMMKRLNRWADPTGMGDDSEYKRVDTGSLRQNVPGGIEAQHKQFVEDTKPVSGNQEEAPKKSIGQKIAGFFGFGDTPVEGRQAGGPVTEGKPYLVGEKGPEIVVPSENSTVVPNDKKAAKAVPQIVETIDMGNGAKKEIMDDGSYTISDAEGITKYNAKGTAVSKITSGFGVRREENLVTGEVNTSYSQGPLYASEKKNKAGDVIESSASYDLGLAKVSSKTAGGKTTTAAEVRGGSEENAAMRDQMTAASGATQPIVSNNVQTNNNTTFTPMKADPRPTHRGSALDKYNDRVAAY